MIFSTIAALETGESDLTQSVICQQIQLIAEMSEVEHILFQANDVADAYFIVHFGNGSSHDETLAYIQVQSSGYVNVRSHNVMEMMSGDLAKHPVTEHLSHVIWTDTIQNIIQDIPAAA